MGVSLVRGALWEAYNSEFKVSQVKNCQLRRSLSSNKATLRYKKMYCLEFRRDVLRPSLSIILNREKCGLTIPNGACRKADREIN